MFQKMPQKAFLDTLRSGPGDIENRHPHFSQGG